MVESSTVTIKESKSKPTKTFFERIIPVGSGRERWITQHEVQLEWYIATGAVVGFFGGIPVGLGLETVGHLAQMPDVISSGVNLRNLQLGVDASLLGLAGLGVLIKKVTS